MCWKDTSLTSIPYSASFAAAVLALLLLAVLHTMRREVSFYMSIDRCSTKVETGTKKMCKTFLSVMSHHSTPVTKTGDSSVREEVESWQNGEAILLPWQVV